MYGLPEDFDPSVFVGRQMTLICYSENSVYFHLNGDVLITLESSCLHCDASGEAGHKEVVPVSSSSLMRLLGKTVVSATGEAGHKEVVPMSSSSLMRLLGKTVVSATGERDGTLALFFDDGQSLRVLDDSTQYEQYHIRVGDREIHV